MLKKVPNIYKPFPTIKVYYSTGSIVKIIYVLFWFFNDDKISLKKYL